MKNKLILAAALATAVMLGGCTREVTIKTMTYNIYSCGHSSVEKIAEIIRANDPDLVSLQEVERNTDTNPSDIPAVLAELTGMPYHYFAHALDLPKKGGDYGNVILSKYPLLETTTIRLGTPGKDYMRSFGYVKTRKDGREFYFGTTHLDHKANDSLRLVQTAEILDVVRELNAPFILAGDFNARPDARPIAMMREWFDIGEVGELQFTVPAPNPEKTIDYLASGPHGRFTTKSYSVYYEAGNASDHYPVVATFSVSR